MNARTRVAPSPTGAPHLGTAYIALFNLCFAKQHGGDFVLRIEDTDRDRVHQRYEKQLLESFHWLGLTWDEGPDRGGDYAPYRQSERYALYRQYAEQLLEKEHAFYCFASAEELAHMRCEQLARGETPRYDGRGLSLSKAEIQRRLCAHEPYVLRLKVPEDGTAIMHDQLRGRIEIEWSQVDMQVLLKSDGSPTYHLANVVDDHLMCITDVIRGEEWINSTPKHLLLYDYLGWQPPKYWHLPLLRHPDKSKLSKRRAPTGILYYRDVGYMPAALLNYLGRMGWSMPDEREKFTLSEMIEHFDMTRISLGGPIFDSAKLNWLNGVWLRELDDATLLADYKKWLDQRNILPAVATPLRTGINKLSDIPEKILFLYQGDIALVADDFTTSHERSLEIVQFAYWHLERCHEWNAENIFATLQTLATAMQLGLNDFFSAIFVAVSGKRDALEITVSMAALGQEVSLSRLRTAVLVLGGGSKKKSRALEKKYHQLIGDSLTS